MQLEKQNLIDFLLKNNKETTWYELAVKFNIKPNCSREQRRKAANDIWRRYKGNKNIIQEELEKTQIPIIPKRLYLDIESSYNIVKSWRIGSKVNLTYKDVIQERKIICIAYKWEGDKEISVLSWNNGNDYEVIKKFVEILNEADEIVGHNIDEFDLKLIATRAIKHNIPILPKFKTSDTLKMARKKFSFESNKLDFIANFLGIGTKIEHRGLEMWDDIILHNDKKALEEMIIYCIGDVSLTEKVYKKLKNYAYSTVNHSLIATNTKNCCPECGSTNLNLEKTIMSNSRIERVLKCADCSTIFNMSNTVYNKNYGEDKK